MKIEAAVADDAPEIVSLWQACGLTRPWNNPDKDFHFALNSADSTVLVGRDGGKIVASIMVGHDGHRGALYYVSVAPEQQGKGFGRAIHNAALDWLKSQGVWKVNLLVRTDNAQANSFYEALGYSQNNAISFGKVIG